MALILVGCEESQAITIALRKLGHEAFSCDLLPCSGGHPEWHIRGDIFEVIKLKKWDMMIAHPPCTFLTNSAVQWLSHPEDKYLPFEDRRAHPKYPTRRQDMLESVEFVKALYNCNIPLVAIENPMGLLSTRYRKPDQIIQPWMFGDEATKTTCLWLKGLPQLTHTKIVGKGERTTFKSGKSHPKWYADALANAKTPEERRTLRSKTFQGIADAIAQQWGDFAQGTLKAMDEYKLQILEQIKFSFDICSDYSTQCLGYRNLVDRIRREKEDKSISPIKKDPWTCDDLLE